MGERQEFPVQTKTVSLFSIRLIVRSSMRPLRCIFHEAPLTSITVDAAAYRVRPESTTKSTCSDRSAMAWCASCGGGMPALFALLATMGTSARLRMKAATS